MTATSGAPLDDRGHAPPSSTDRNADADGAFLRDLVDYLFAAVGHSSIKSFWLVGHSQGGMTSNRIVCTDFFKDKVDGWLSLPGGSGPRPGVAATPGCNINFIFSTPAARACARRMWWTPRRAT